MTDANQRPQSDFRTARARATLRKFVGLISGHKRDLLSFSEVQIHLRPGGLVYRGVHAVPLAKIVGSVDRYRDFDHLFSPTQSHTSERRKRTSRAWYVEKSHQ